MTRRPLSRTEQLDLLAWEPPETVARFEDHQVRAATITGRLCKAISAGLGQCGKPREQVAEAMSAFLGQRVSLNMLNAYASEGHESHQISAVRFVALVHATGDRRLLELLAEMFGWAVIERRHLPMIELAAVQERREELGRHADALRRQARGKGIL